MDDAIKTSETFGGVGGAPFSFLEAFGRRLPERISIRSESRLDNIAFTYDGEVLSAGGSGGSFKELGLADGEYVISMQLGRARRTVISTYRVSYIKLTTNLGNTLGCGVSGGEEHTFTAPDGYAIVGVYGFSGDEIDRLGAIYLQVGE